MPIGHAFRQICDPHVIQCGTIGNNFDHTNRRGPENKQSRYYTQEQDYTYTRARLHRQAHEYTMKSTTTKFWNHPCKKLQCPMQSFEATDAILRISSMELTMMYNSNHICIFLVAAKCTKHASNFCQRRIYMRCTVDLDVSDTLRSSCH